MTGEPSGPNGDPHCAETERLLAGLHFTPRASLGPEIAGRVRRGESPRRGEGPPRSATLRSVLGIAAAMMLTVSAGVLTWKAVGPAVHVDSCCQDLDGGGSPDDGFVLNARGRTVSRLELYEDRDGSRSRSADDVVRFTRDGTARLGGEHDARATRVCCSDLDGEGKADDGVVVLSEAGQSVVLAAVYEQLPRGAAAPLR
jgi:hypothetical protein